ncbi:SIR2 family protein [Pseudomonas chlororaphis]
MDFFALEERLAPYGSGGYLFLEAFLTKLLQIEAAHYGHEVNSLDTHTSLFDAVAPQGIGDITTPVFIEYLFSATKNRVKLLLDSFRMHGEPGFGLLIIAPKMPEPTPSYILHEPDAPGHTPVVIWGESKINDLMHKHKDEVNKLTDSLFSLRLKMAATRPTKPWLEERDQLIKLVAERYRSGSFSLVLGAGVSSSAGLPDWNTLLNSLFVSMLAQENIGEDKSDTAQVSQIVSRLMEVDGPSALMLARYIRKGLSVGSPTEQQGFIEAITNQLYSLRNTEFPIESELITAIARLCTPSRTGAKVRSILTYNFDDFIERALSGRSLIHKSIFEEFETPSAEELPVYHVHGFLPEARDKYSNLDRCTLVFSEEGYHLIYRDAYHWSNLVQLNSLKETSCLMIGLSLTDPNLRRLLEIASKSIEKPKHYAFMRRLTSKKFKSGDRGHPLKIPSSVIDRFLDRHHSTNEELMRELGVTLIWYEEYADIPIILNRIREG